MKVLSDLSLGRPSFLIVAHQDMKQIQAINILQLALMEWKGMAIKARPLLS